MLTSGLLIIREPTVQLLVALAVSATFMVVYREWKPFYELQTDALSYVCGKNQMSSLYARMNVVGISFYPKITFYMIPSCH